LTRVWCLVLGLVVALAGPAGAAELWRDGNASLELTGSLRELLRLGESTDAGDYRRRLAADPNCALQSSFPNCSAWNVVGNERVLDSLTRIRTRLDLRASESWSAVVVYDHELLAGKLDTLESKIGEELSTRQWNDLGSRLVSNRNFEWRHALYRANVVYEGEQLEVTLGRQRVPWGVGRLWNPIDRFNAIGPLAIEADQSAGVDAAKLRWLFSGFTYVEAIYALGEHEDDRAYALRLHGVVKDVDYSLMGGVFEEAPTLGLDLASNLGDAAGRIEAVWTRPTREVRPFGTLNTRPLPAYWQIVVSVDRDFDLGSGLYVLVEYLYNGNALGFGRGKAGRALGSFQERNVPAVGRVPAQGSSDLLGHSRVVSAGEHLAGVQFGYDLLADLRGNFVVLVDWQGESAGFFPSLVYSPLGWLELTLGVQVFAGPRHSEYGNLDPLGFLMAEAFF
jgi:hypothetical protein